MSDELIPCPYCGAGETRIDESARVWTGMKFSEPSSVSVKHWCVEIPGQPRRMIERIGRDRASAIDAWNMRAAPEGFALVPLVLNRAMNEVISDEGWQWEDLLAAAEAITEEQYNAIAAIPDAPKEWRCFHCDEVFTDEAAAREHFGSYGPRILSDPACQIDAAEYRAMEQRMADYNAEDAAIHRQMAGMEHEHKTALRREEEKGYARGLEASTAALLTLDRMGYVYTQGAELWHRTYTTKAGESVMGIALRECGNEMQWRHILACNPQFSKLLPHEYFPVGTVLTLPPREVKRAPSFIPVAERHCQNGHEACLAGRRDGVVCPADSCDIDDGTRKP